MADGYDTAADFIGWLSDTLRSVSAPASMAVEFHLPYDAEKLLSAYRQDRSPIEPTSTNVEGDHPSRGPRDHVCSGRYCLVCFERAQDREKNS